MESAPHFGRRHFIAGATAAVATSISLPAWAMPRVPARRALSLGHLHTGESLDIVYWADGHYQPGAIRRITWLMRDFRTDQVHPIHPRLLDLMAAMQQHLHVREPLLIVSAYRSPATNAMLARESEGVATNSLHMRGAAVDIRVPGRPLAAVRRVAVALRGGGVGSYPHSNFTHLDVGPVRYW